MPASYRLYEAVAVQRLLKAEVNRSNAILSPILPLYFVQKDKIQGIPFCLEDKDVRGCCRYNRFIIVALFKLLAN